MSTGDSKRHVINTASGVRLDFDDPRPEDIRIEDVAGGLSKVCRFAAQPLEYYSVAQHALLVRQLVVKAGHPALALVALHHDSHEAYLGDVPTPLKKMIREATNVYDQVSEKFDVGIAKAFGFVWPAKGSPDQKAIKHADNMAFLMEAAWLLHNGGQGLHQDREINAEELRNLGPMEEPLSPVKAEALFLEAHEELLKHTT